MRLRNLPLRLATGAYVFHTGWEKWRGDAERAEGIHAMAAGAFPVFRPVPPRLFLKALAAAEMGLGAALLTPFVPRRRAGAGLTAFAGGLVAMYLRTPALHKPGSIWPTQAGTAVSKDSWLLAIGLGLLLDRSKHRGHAQPPAAVQ
jgi:uncharacterized membrane protein YphA (DoxX/SURF4 family)